MAGNYIPFLLALGACYSGEKAQDTGENNQPSADTEKETGESFPPRPTFTMTVGGAESMDLDFDRPTCTSQVNSGNLRIFWRAGIL